MSARLNLVQNDYAPAMALAVLAAMVARAPSVARPQWWQCRILLRQWQLSWRPGGSDGVRVAEVEVWVAVGRPPPRQLLLLLLLLLLPMTATTALQKKKKKNRTSRCNSQRQQQENERWSVCTTGRRKEHDNRHPSVDPSAGT